MIRPPHHPARGSRAHASGELGPRARSRGESGQATVELVALLPLLVAVALAVLGLLAAYGAREGADQAAVAAAIAQLQELDPKAAAKAAAPSWTRTRVVIARGEVRVDVRPRIPRAIAQLVDARRVVIFDPAAGNN